MAEILPMLALSPTMEEGVVALWLKKEGDTVENGEVICEVETDKATMEYTSMADGILLKIVIPTNGSGRVGEPLAVIGQAGESFDELLASSVVSAPATVPVEAPPIVAMDSVINTAATEGKVRATPAARGLASEKGIDLHVVVGSGPNGRVILADVEAMKGGRIATGSVDTEQSDERIPLSTVRKVIASRLSASKFTAPHFYMKLSVQMDQLIKLRRDLNSMHSSKISFNAFMMKMVAQALKRNLMINSSWNADSIIQHHRVDIALAVSIDSGLVTPVIRDCCKKSITEIDEELVHLIEKAKSGDLLPDEYSESTFTISNLGSYGIEEFTAIINPPGSAILAVGQTRREQVVGADDKVSIKSILKLTLSCDHRVIDGVAGAHFMRDLKRLIEEPSLALG